MKRLEQKRDCCGCGACAAACPAGAIVLRADGEGFLYPEFDLARCANCGLCERVCPMGKRGTAGEKRCFAARLKDAGELRHSQSGGLFWALAQDALADGGAVYGAAYDGELVVRHVRAETAEAARALRGSKYVQSEPGDAFARARDDLRAGRRVLYSGTPCQIEGLRRFLGPLADDENLLLCDIVCFGTFSPAVYRRMLDFQGDVRAFAHRDKRFGWRAKTQTYTFADGREVSDANLWALYTDGLALRPSCESCPFNNQDRPGDVTMGDFWGVERVFPDWDDDAGVSLAMVNTPRGERALARAEARLLLRPCSTEDAVSGQPRLRGQRLHARGRDKFWRDFRRLPFERLLRRYTPRGGARYLCKKKLRRWLRERLRRLRGCLRK